MHRWARLVVFSRSMHLLHAEQVQRWLSQIVLDEAAA